MSLPRATNRHAHTRTRTSNTGTCASNAGTYASNARPRPSNARSCPSDARPRPNESFAHLSRIHSYVNTTTRRCHSFRATVSHATAGQRHPSRHCCAHTNICPYNPFGSSTSILAEPSPDSRHRDCCALCIRPPAGQRGRIRLLPAEAGGFVIIIIVVVVIAVPPAETTAAYQRRCAWQQWQ